MSTVLNVFPILWALRRALIEPIVLIVELLISIGHHTTLNYKILEVSPRKLMSSLELDEVDGPT